MKAKTPLTKPEASATRGSRGAVQNSMEPALCDNGLAWGLYELNQALHIALTNDECEPSGVPEQDVLEAAAIHDIDPREMAETFNAIKAHPGC